MSETHKVDPHGHGPTESFDRDISVKAIIVTGVGLALLTAAAMVLMWWVAQRFKGESMAADPPRSPIAEANERQLPPEPRLQGAPGSAFPEQSGAPELELEQVRAAEDRLLNEYGWIDPEDGLARIPVDRALAIVAERGLPERPVLPTAEEAAPPAAAGNEGETP